jgi:hypothetical protein
VGDDQDIERLERELRELEEQMNTGGGGGEEEDARVERRREKKRSKKDRKKRVKDEDDSDVKKAGERAQEAVVEVDASPEGKVPEVPEVAEKKAGEAVKAEKAPNFGKGTKKEIAFKLDEETLKTFDKRQKDAYDKIQANMRQKQRTVY